MRRLLTNWSVSSFSHLSMSLESVTAPIEFSALQPKTLCACRVSVSFLFKHVIRVSDSANRIRCTSTKDILVRVGFRSFSCLSMSLESVTALIEFSALQPKTLCPCRVSVFFLFKHVIRVSDSANRIRCIRAQDTRFRQEYRLFLV
jgi:hypothetical protein